MAHIIDGKAIARTIRSEVAEQVRLIVNRNQRKPGLNLLLVGEDPASNIYVRNKSKDCEQVGIASVVQRLPADVTEEQVIEIIELWNADKYVDGILVQLPLPRHIDEHRVIRTIDPSKDVDGFHPISAGNLMIGIDGFIPCTPAGVLELLKRSNIDPGGMHAVVVGRSNIVGKPLSMLLAQKRPQGNATVTICHTGTKDLIEYTRTADLLVAAIGRAQAITREHVKEGAVVIDVGINRISTPNGETMVGDVDYASVFDVVRAITPVPGGVGPMTRAMLLTNTLRAYHGLQQ